MAYEIVTQGELRTIVYPEIPVAHGHSTRSGGVSSGPYASLNLSISTGDALSHVQENRRLLGQALGLEPILPRLKMSHGVQVACLGPLFPRETDLAEADACITDQPIPLCITTADCVPLIFYCPEKRAVGLAHAGWRGTVNGIAKETVAALQLRYGCRPAELRVAIGPCIGRCCFEVGPEVAQEFSHRFPQQAVVSPRHTAASGCHENKFEVDLHRANRLWLLAAGVAPEHIQHCDLCTACRGDLFFSHRRTGGLTGRMMTVIQTSRV